MRVNVYAEEMTDRVELVTKEIDGATFTAVRFYLELPATGPDGAQHRGPFVHRPGDDDSAAVTFWGKQDLRPMLRKALDLLNAHYTAGVARRVEDGAPLCRRCGHSAWSHCSSPPQRCASGHGGRVPCDCHGYDGSARPTGEP